VSVNDDPAVGADLLATAGGFELRATRPNPFRERATIPFSLASAAPVSAAVFDVTGRRVRLLADGRLREAGEHELRWDGRDDQGRRVAPGLYACRVQAGSSAAARKMLLVR
jgi:hypothetical protein